MTVSNKIISRLLGGIEQFSKKECFFDSAYNKIVEKGQSPKVMVVSCSDSLVDPTSLMDSKPGELFIHRNIAGLVPKYKENARKDTHATSAALEHGIKNLKVEHLIILGHAYCGGIDVLLKSSPDESSDDSFIKSWMKIASTAKTKTKDKCSHLSYLEQRHFCEKESVILSLENLMTFPWIEKRVKENDLLLHGWYFDRGRLSIYDTNNKHFKDVN
jgi:carbonic anhydrase